MWDFGEYRFVLNNFFGLKANFFLGLQPGFFNGLFISRLLHAKYI